MSDFFQGTPPSRFQTPVLQRIANAVHERRDKRKEEGASSTSCNRTEVLSPEDAAFVEEYAKASKLKSDEIESVVKALRARESSN